MILPINQLMMLLVLPVLKFRLKNDKSSTSYMTLLKYKTEITKKSQLFCVNRM